MARLVWQRVRPWPLLLPLSLLLVALLELVRIPAALLLGPMVAAILFAARGAEPRIAPPLFFAAQAIIGTMIAQSMTVATFAEVAADWPLFLVSVLAVIFASTALGLLLARFQVLPGSTAIWGSSPGAASAMVLLSESFGADMRLVAFMQYLRVAIVASLASTVAAVALPATGDAPRTSWLGPVDPLQFVLTVGVAAVAAVLARRFRLPAGAMLGPLAAATLLQDLGLLTITLPPLLLAAAYALLGWTIGGRFTPAILRHAARAFPRVLASILTLVAICGGFAWALVQFGGKDPLTAYLATSPGGADSVAIIAASTPVDVPFVMAMQTLRFLLVLLIGPPLARFVARRLPDRSPAAA